MESYRAAEEGFRAGMHGALIINPRPGGVGGPVRLVSPASVIVSAPQQGNEYSLYFSLYFILFCTTSNYRTDKNINIKHYKNS